MTITAKTADQARVIAARHQSQGRRVAIVRTVAGLAALVAARNN